MNETLVKLPKDEAGKPERAPVNSQLDVTEAIVSVAEKLTAPISVSEAAERNASEV